MSQVQSTEIQKIYRKNFRYYRINYQNNESFSKIWRPYVPKRWLKFFWTNQTKAEIDARINWVQSDGNGLGPMQGILFDFREKALFLPNRLAKQLNKYNSWKRSDAKPLVEIFSLRRGKLEDKVRLNWNRSVRNESIPKEWFIFDPPETFWLLAKKLAKATELVKQLNTQRGKKLCWHFFDKPNRNGW